MGLVGGNLPPAAVSLSPQSDFIKWVNQRSRVAPVPAYTIYGDIMASFKQCDFFVLNCHTGSPTSYGDMLLLPGDSDPTAQPAQGGAKYLNGSLGPDNFQWGLHKAYTVDSLIGANLETEILAGIDLYNSSPVSHGQLEGNLDSVLIPDCATGQSTSISAEILKIIAGRMSGNHVQCLPQYGDQ
jgi:hypothetical protein